MYSLNIPVPGRVAALASEIAREVPGARARPRGEHTLGVKRLGTGDDDTYSHIEARAREALVGQPAFEVRIASVDYFPDAITGPEPVIHLVVESEELHRLHLHLSDIFPPVEGIEGEGYNPHVTVARGGSTEAAERISERAIDPITWTVTELIFWDAVRKQPVSRVSLPA